MADGLSELYQDLLNGSYDCVDRIVLNGYFRQGHSAGGFRVWWRQLYGSDENLDNTHLMRLAGRIRMPCSFSSAVTIVPSSIPNRFRKLAGTMMAPASPLWLTA